MSSAVKFLLLVVGVTTLVVCRHGDAFSTGPPSSVCRTMMPSHLEEPSTDQSPYVVTFNRRSQQSSRQSFNVTISSPSGSTFKGFLLQARKARGQNAGRVVGTFVSPPRRSPMKLVCNSKAVSHRIARRQNSITATWRAPLTATDEQIIFTATVVQTYRNFWVNVTSQLLDLGE